MTLKGSIDELTDYIEAKNLEDYAKNILISIKFLSQRRRAIREELTYDSSTIVFEIANPAPGVLVHARNLFDVMIILFKKRKKYFIGISYGQEDEDHIREILKLIDTTLRWTIKDRNYIKRFKQELILRDV